MARDSAYAFLTRKEGARGRLLLFFHLTVHSLSTILPRNITMAVTRSGGQPKAAPPQTQPAKRKAAKESKTPKQKSGKNNLNHPDLTRQE
jgi:hypothetical protein